MSLHVPIYITEAECFEAAKIVVEHLGIGASEVVHGISRGGLVPAWMISKISGCSVTDDPSRATIIVDDLIDSGATMRRYQAEYPARYAALFGKEASLVHLDSPLPFIGRIFNGSPWLVFPWEMASTGKDESKHDAVTRMLQAIGEDPSREGLLETPSRVVKAWGEWFKGYRMDEKEVFKVFEDGAENVDEMVILTNIPVFSHCEHHITPIVGVAHVGYIPSGKIVGLSKLARVVDMYSRRLQVQERLTNQIADCIERNLSPQGIGVVISAKHFCMATRGVHAPNVDTITSAMRGALRVKPEARAEFMRLLP